MRNYYRMYKEEIFKAIFIIIGLGIFGWIAYETQIKQILLDNKLARLEAVCDGGSGDAGNPKYTEASGIHPALGPFISKEESSTSLNSSSRGSLTLSLRSFISKEEAIPIDSIEIIVCVPNNKLKHIEACDYSDRNENFVGIIHRYITEIDVELREANGGKVIATERFVSDEPEDCPFSAQFLDGSSNRSYQYTSNYFPGLEDWINDYIVRN